jgi:CBS domain-containing protein
MIGHGNRREEKMITAKEILRTEYMKADKEETLARVNSRIQDEAFSDVLVFEGETLIGVFSPSRASMIVPSKDNMAEMKIGKLAKAINPLEEEAELSEIMIKMLGTGYNIVPISRGGKIVGVVHLFDLLDAIKLKFEGLKVSDIELQKPIELSEEEGVGKAIQLLHENINNTILIKDKDNTPIGILNHYDLLRNLKLDSFNEDRQKSKGYKSEREDMYALPISDFIKDKNFTSVSSGDTILDVIEELKANNVISLVVEDTSSLIRSWDILSSLEKNQRAKTRAVDFVGLDKLGIEDSHIASVKSTVEKGYERIKDILQQDAYLKAHIKAHSADDGNKRHKYSVVLHLEYSGSYISIDNVSDWNLEEAVKKAMDELESRINRISRSQGTEARDSAESHHRARVPRNTVDS